MDQDGEWYYFYKVVNIVVPGAIPLIPGTWNCRYCFLNHCALVARVVKKFVPQECIHSLEVAIKFRETYAPDVGCA